MQKGIKHYIFLIFSLGLILLCGCSKEIIVSFDSDGGSIIESQNVTETGKVSKPEDPEKSGYIFSGWQLNGTEFNFDNKVEESITLKAKWIEGVELLFSGAGIEDFTILAPKGVEFELPIPEREGYRFVAWADEEENEYKDKGTFTDSVFFEVVWEKIEVYNLVYRDDEITLKNITVIEGENVPEYRPEKKGYTFSGWYTNTTYTKEFDFSKLNRSNAIYAKFIPNEYVIKFKTLNKSKAVKFDGEIGELPTISIPGASFYGWEYNGERIYSFTQYVYDEDIELNPVVTVKSVFSLSDTDNRTVEYYVGSTGPYTEVYKPGYVFAGWFSNKDFTGDAMFTIDTTDYANKYLYAKFVEGTPEESLSQVIVKEVINYYDELLNEKYIYDNMVLMNKDLYYGADITWSSDSPNVTSNGNIIREKVDKEVHLTAKVEYKGYVETATYTIILKEKPFKDISKNVVVSYCYTGTLGSRGVDQALLDVVDVVNLAFADAQEDAGLILNFSYVELFNGFKEAAKKAGVRTVIVIGPPSNPAIFEAIAKSDDSRKKFASNIVDAINKYGFNGVDIDWEYPTSTSRTLYTALMKEIYEQVKRNNPEDLVTSAIPAGPYSYGNYDLKNSTQYLDFINLMSYDMQGESSATHHTALFPNTSAGATISGCSIDETVKNFTGKTCNVPANKIVIGAAFYGRKNTLINSTSTKYLGMRVADTENKYTSVTYTGIKNNYLNLDTCQEYYDTTAQVPYCFDTATRTFITYDNPRSIKAKCDYLTQQGLRGIMWWDYGSDQTGDLLAAVKSKLSTMKN